MTQTKTVRELAEELSNALERKGRANGAEYVLLKDNSPQWMTDVVRAVHGDKLPDDTVYAMIERCADAIANESDVYEIEPDAYTHDLTAWLHARVDHVDYLTQAIEEYAPKDGFQALALAQTLQIQEIGTALVAALERISDIEG